MKKLFYSAALILLSAAVSCQKESLLGPEGKGELMDVTFSISTEGTLATKGIGDADLYEKKLTFLVYKDGKYLDQLVPVIEDFNGVSDIDAKVTVKLVKGQTYDFVFWAQSEAATCYSITTAYPPVLNVTYDKPACNDENRDAFYAILKGQKITADMPMQTVELYRPFAQINVGTTAADIADAEKAGVVINKTSVTLGNVATAFDFFSEKVSGEKSVTFESAAIPTEDLMVYEGTANEKSYEYLALNYILVSDLGNEGKKDLLENFSVSFYQDDALINTISVPSVPVSRNWRTNIIGENVLTDYATFEIIIIPPFKGEHIVSTAPYLTVDKASLSPAATDVQASYKVSSNAEWSVTAPAGVTATPASGNADAEVVLTFAANNSWYPKSYPVTVQGAGETITVNVGQAGMDKILYLKPNDNWVIDNARFAAYFFGNGETWVGMTDPDGDGVYQVNVPDGYPSVIFCRMNPSATDNNWGTKWNQTGDLTVPSDLPDVLYTVPAGFWDGSDNSSWSSIN